ncbi:ammonium transporter [Acidocella aminolytica 101 = DSM 11237]|jgi:Amt family ammonium transporter|uniref:Ammonium transporter n=3 Tax=Acidocella TaxID=50709 RepID=A0A0D6PHX4_9PROT|nr:ammonium transporter [Acidocella aminolytica 101 = DSM 11237]
MAQTAAPTLNSGDTAWMLTSSAIVLMMTVPGLALYYAGLLRKKNMLAMLMQCFFTTALVTVLWCVVGYSLAFTAGNPLFGGFSRVMLEGTGLNGLSGTIPETVFAFFQCTFAIITPALILGGPADRLKFSSSMVFIGIWLLLVYCPIAHMVWGPGGFLGNLGVLDFAGGTVVHIDSAVPGLIAAIMVGKRSGYGRENMAPANMGYAMIGASMLWVGWFGFNAGSALTAGGQAGMAAINTQLATAAAVLSWTLAEWAVKGKPSLLGAISGAVAGLVAITPACGFVPVGGALVIGLAAGVVCFWGVTGFKNMFGYDDALDVWGVHGLGGILGALLTGVFAVSSVGGAGHSGLIDGNAGQVLIQAEGVIVTIVYDAVVSYILLKLIDITMGLRVSKEEEIEGLDINQHGEVISHG